MVWTRTELHAQVEESTIQSAHAKGTCLPHDVRHPFLPFWAGDAIGTRRRARHVGAPGVWGCHGRLAVLGPYRGPPQPQPTMTLKLKPSPSPPASPFTWDLSPPSPPTHDLERPPSPPTSWLSARDMKTFGAEPLVQEVGIVKCKDCRKQFCGVPFLSMQVCLD